MKPIEQVRSFLADLSEGRTRRSWFAASNRRNSKRLS